MYFLGAEHLAKCFIPMWNRIHDQLHTNKVVAAAFPNDSDGDAFRAVFPPIVEAAGYTFDMSSPYPDGTTNYSSMIAQFKADKADFFTNVPLPPDFAAMWKQSLQQGFRPKLATVAKVLLFPTDAYAMGSEVYNVATDTWWVPTLPWKSTFTGEDCQTIGERVRVGHRRPVERQHQQLQPLRGRLRGLQIGERPARQERSRQRHPQREHPGARRAARLRLWRPRTGRCDHPPAGVQWQKGTKYPLELQVVDNTLLPQAKITADLVPTNT